nr:putative leucine-rich repeat-containing protein DDB_G0290503 [Parasteatoda tepidariorum]
MSVQNELQFAKDMKELVDIRAADARRNLEKNREISNTLFSQQRSELTGQLSALEEKRLQRSNQLSYLKRLENDLEEKIAMNEREEREEEKLRVSNLLEKKRTFQNMVDNLCAESTEVFQLTLPVYAKRQLYDNVCLRRLCDEVSENILDEQDRNRHLTKIEKILNVEKETQIYTEDLLKSQLHKLNSDLEYLVESEAKLRFVNTSEDEADIKDKYLEIRNMIGELCRVEDERTDLLKISKDQEEYKVVLEKQLEEKIDLNGRMMSAILRAGKIVHSRIKEVGGKSEYDLEFLRQISMLLEDFLD